MKKNYVAIFLLIMFTFMVGCSGQQITSAKKPVDTEPDQPKVKTSTEVKALAYYDPPNNDLRIYICGTITNKSKVPIRINAVTLRSEDIYGEEVDKYTSTSTDSQQGIFPLILMPGESAYIARNSDPIYIGTKENFKKTTMEVDAVPVDPAYAKKHKSLISVSNVKKRQDKLQASRDTLSAFSNYPLDRLVVSYRITNNATHIIKNIRSAVVLFDKRGDAIGVVTDDFPIEFYAKVSGDLRLKIVDNHMYLGGEEYNPATGLEETVGDGFIPYVLFKQIHHIKVIAEPPVDESANASSSSGGSDAGED